MYQHLPLQIARTSKSYTNCDFWFENKTSGNPVMYINEKQICPPLSKAPSHCHCPANPTTMSYNAIAVNIYNAPSSLVRFENKNIFS
jgi:hypothetical protein